MFKLDESKLTNIFNYFAPKSTFRGILSIPHSGEEVPAEFTHYLTSDSILIGRDIDFKVNELVDIDRLTDAGIAVIVSNIHRTCIDLNRASEICVLNWKSNSHGEQLVIKEPTKQVTEELTQKYYAPYYEMLKSLINALYKEQPGVVSLIDLHSMPSTPTKYHLDINPNQKMERPDFCVSDIEGISCTKEFIDFVCSQLKPYSNWVTQNDPYFGGHVTRHIHATYQNINNIQIEINRKIYMDEAKRELNTSLVKELKLNLTNSLIKSFEHFSQ